MKNALGKQEDGNFRDATDVELDELNEDRDLVYQHVINRLY